MSEKPLVGTHTACTQQQRDELQSPWVLQNLLAVIKRYQTTLEDQH